MIESRCLDLDALKKLLITLFRGSDSGQSLVEYLTIVGACALVGIAGFTRYGQVVKKDLSADAKHIEGEGLPNTEGILGSLGADYNELPGWCVKPNYCFAAGTPVETERGDRSIESIAVGERVWARDVTTGAIALRSVVNTYRTARVPVVDLELSVGHVTSEHLTVTRGHLFWVEGPGWVRADALGAQPLWSTEGSTAARFSTELLGGDSELTTVYNLEVSEFHSYFVGHSHVLVHNGNPNSDGSCTNYYFAWHDDHARRLDAAPRGSPREKM
jgi:Pretoxin HINT domain